MSTEVRFYREVVDMRLALYGDRHPDVAVAYAQLGRALGRLRKLDEAIAVNRKALALRRLLFLLTHRSPADLPTDGLTIKLRSYIL